MHLRKFFLLSHVVLCANFRDNFVLGIFENPLASACDKTKCTLPECFLNEYNIPCNLSLKETPQFVMISYHGTMRKEIFEKFKELFAYKTNPNNKPITATFFIQHAHTDYNYVSQLHSEGHEVGSFGISEVENSDTWNKTMWEKAMKGQCKNLLTHANISKEHCKGLRAPNLKIGGDNQFQMMIENNFEYDYSIESAFEDKIPWPIPLIKVNYTQTYCSLHQQCPYIVADRVWSVLLPKYKKEKFFCNHMIKCDFSKNEDDIFKCLNNDFFINYFSNKAPFSIVTDEIFYRFYEKEWKVLKRFLKKLSAIDDVYIVSVSEVIQWMKQPFKLN